MSETKDGVATEDVVKGRADQIWDILVSTAGASEEERERFVQCWPSSEYRFMGHLGFGGKVRYIREGAGWHTQVDCYPEDRNSERDAIIIETNEKIKAARL